MSGAGFKFTQMFESFSALDLHLGVPDENDETSLFGVWKSCD